MPVYAMPVVIMIEADSVEEAQQSMDEWGEELDFDVLPAGTEDIVVTPNIDTNDEGQRMLYLPSTDDCDDESDDDFENDKTEEDDFNDGEADF